MMLFCLKKIDSIIIFLILFASLSLLPIPVAADEFIKEQSLQFVEDGCSIDGEGCGGSVSITYPEYVFIENSSGKTENKLTQEQVANINALLPVLLKREILNPQMLSYEDIAPTSIKQLFDLRVQECKSNYDDGTKSYCNFNLAVNTAYRKEDTDCMKVVGSEYNVGAAHGYGWTRYYCISLSSARLLKLSDVIDDTKYEELGKIIDQKSMAKLSKRGGEESRKDGKKLAEDADIMHSFYFDATGIIFVFDKSWIAHNVSYPANYPVEIKIAYSELYPLLRQTAR